MGDYLIADSSFINSIIGEGTSFRGDLRTEGVLRIDGDFAGSIETTGKVLVGKNGRAECMIKGNTVVIGGIVKGDVYAAEKVVILSTGMLIGNVSAPRFIVEDGVVFNGVCIVKDEMAEQDLQVDKSYKVDFTGIQAETVPYESQQA